MSDAYLSQKGLTFEQELEHQLSMIRQYVAEHKVPPHLVGRYFSAGLSASRVLNSPEPGEGGGPAVDAVGQGTG